MTVDFAKRLADPRQVFCVFDYETYSEVDLKAVGAFEYSVHPSTEIICAAWCVGTREQLADPEWPVHVWTDGELPDDVTQDGVGGLVAALTNPDVLVVAHNALFEQLITKHVLAREMYTRREALSSLPPSRYICTAALAAAMALPRNLEGAALALKLPVQKDMAGRRLMLKWCKPRKPSKKNPALRHDDPAELSALLDYCATDVETEKLLFMHLPPLSPTERRVWVLDQEINLRGFLADRPLVQTVLGMIDEETRAIDERTVELSLGLVESATKVDELQAWLAGEGLYLPNMQKKTIEDALADGLAEGDARTMLELRQARSKTSTAKYIAFEARSRYDGRVRDILVYHTASTGRWGGAGVQPQNFPRGTIKNSLQAAELLAAGDLEMVRLVYGDPMAAFSSCLRNVIIAPDGYTLDVADYNAIEARVLFWVAGHADGLRAFRENRPLYEEMAAVIFGVPPETIGEKSFERFLGKSAVLGCGYSMGWKKFADTCRAQGRPIGEDLAERTVKAYRQAHAPVVQLWSAMERAAVAAAQSPGRVAIGGGVSWQVSGEFLFCRLPSGRRLAYYGPTVRHETTPWGDTRPVLYHWGVDGLTRKWVNAKTYGGKLVENVVQAIARDLMAEAMLRIEDAGPWKIVLSVHDELAAERRVNSRVGYKDFCALMSELPPWAAGCPVKAVGWSGPRYRKD